MRVIAGKFGSRSLRTLRGMAMRPSSDRLRETLFNILGPAVEGSCFVDVFAGSGAVGIEALSRGARQAFFIERHRAAALLIGENLDSLGMRDEAEIIRADAIGGLEQLASRHILADFIFLDPPYGSAADYARVLAYLDESRLCPSRGRIIVEHGRKTNLPERMKQLELTRKVEQGDSALRFYRWAALCGPENPPIR